MSLVNSLAIGDADPATLVKGRDQTPVSSTVQNKKLFINLKSFDNAGGQLTRLFGGRVCPCRLKQLQALGIERVAVSSCKIHRPNLTIRLATPIECASICFAIFPGGVSEPKGKLATLSAYTLTKYRWVDPGGGQGPPYPGSP
jgi:hypothetical protein